MTNQTPNVNPAHALTSKIVGLVRQVPPWEMPPIMFVPHTGEWPCTPKECRDAAHEASQRVRPWIVVYAHDRFFAYPIYGSHLSAPGFPVWRPRPV